MSTIIVSALLAAVVGGIIYRLIKNRKEGKGSCGCGCGGCSMSDSCHKKSPF